MKKIVILLALALNTLAASTQVPNSFNYQAVIRNADGTVKANTSVSVQISILQGSVSGSDVYQEIHNTTTNSLGLVVLEIGDGVSSQSFLDIDWGNGPYFISTTVNGASMGVTQLLSVPYALYSESSSSVDYVDYNDISNKPSSFNPSYHTHTELEIADLKHYTDSDIDGNESAFSGWDKDSSDDFDGDFNSLKNRPDVSSFISEEVDPLFSSHVSSGILQSDISNWNLALSWGNHSLAGYLQAEEDGSITNEIQDLNLVEDELSISSDLSTVDLSKYLDNTDNQGLILNSDILTIENGTGNVDLSNYIDDADPDPLNEIQDLQLSENILSITGNATPAELSLIPYLDNTDNQNLSLSDNNLAISGGNNVDLSGYVYNEGNGIDISAENTISIHLDGNQPGDILFFQGSEWSRLPKGQDGQVLTMNNDLPSWQDPPIHYLGEEFCGGIVVSLSADKKHGTVVSIEPISEQPGGAIWGPAVTVGNPPIVTGATSTSDGMSNTLLIVSVLGDNGGVPYAAKLCVDYRGGGYDDWYLPTYNQLIQLYYLSQVISPLTLPTTSFWSSAYSCDFGHSFLLKADSQS
ncbi:MAG: hypothetical protein PQJ50_07465 [Spirochaetales bacterium]|nr:hypothetical protein [Spirochaetales bacterium]